jgi:hypothetical protein
LPRDFRPRSASPISRILLIRRRPPKPRLHEHVEGIFSQAAGDLQPRMMNLYEVRRLRELRAVVKVLYWYLVSFLTLNVPHVSTAETPLWFGLLIPWRWPSSGRGGQAWGIRERLRPFRSLPGAAHCAPCCSRFSA